MPIILLSELVAGVTVAEATQQELTIAQTLGLATTAWQPLGMARTILAINAQEISTASDLIAFIAQGGYASYAALMVDGDGNPVTTWMDLRSVDQYNVTRIPASFASGPVPVSNSSASAYPFTPGQLRFQNASGATYSNTASGTILAGASGFDIQIEADIAGPSGSYPAGQTLILLTPLSGVTVNPLGSSLVGSPAETNAALLSRCIAKLGSLSPNGAPGAYDYVAKSIPQAAAASATPPYTVTAPINRTADELDIGNGVVDVIIANAAGAPSGGDLAAVNAAIQALAVPQGITVNVIAATNHSIAITCTVYYPVGLGLDHATIIANIETAIDAYFSQLPIGGVSTSATGIVPLTDILATIFNANRGTLDVTLSVPSANVSLGLAEVPVRGSTSITVTDVT